MWVAKAMREEQMTPAGVKPIVDTSVLPICHPYGALAVHSMWAFYPYHVCCAAIAYINILLSLILKSELLNGEAFMY